VSKENKDRRKAIRDELRRRERAGVEAKAPLSKPKLKQLFGWVDIKLGKAGCDDTLKHSIPFLRVRGVAEDEVVAWLKEEDGYCDCEVIANVEDRWREILGGEI
jgi:hypothetical protein